MRLVLTLQPRLVARRVPGDRTFVGILELSISLCTQCTCLACLRGSRVCLAGLHTTLVLLAGMGVY